MSNPCKTDEHETPKTNIPFESGSKSPILSKSAFPGPALNFDSSKRSSDMSAAANEMHGFGETGAIWVFKKV